MKKLFINISFAAGKHLLFYIKMKKIKLNPWQYLIISFLFLISLGTLIFSSPFVTHEQGLSFIDSLFTATSAVCVTGLSTVKTSGFNIYGELVLLILMQLGAIGIMTLSSSFILALRGEINLTHKILFLKTQENNSFDEIYHILKFILIITFVSEILGAILLSFGFSLEGYPFWQSIHYGVFHSVSAFCNAGFSIFDNSLEDTNLIIKYTVMFMIIIGGIGYYVIFDLYRRLRTKRYFSLHTKIVLLSTFFLILGGAIFIFFFEDGNISITDSLFQSITARTAGFNTIDLHNLHYFNLLIITLLMFVGASPGSTGGGIKTTTFFIVIYSIFKILKGEKEINIFNRQISNETVLKSFAILAAYFMIIFLGALLLLYHTSYDFLSTLFEVTSAVGTVGLSLGITAVIGTYGKLILILLMFIGRVGPVSLVMITSKKQKKIKIKYPKELVF